MTKASVAPIVEANDTSRVAVAAPKSAPAAIVAAAPPGSEVVASST